MTIADPRSQAVFTVKVVGDARVGKTSLAAALLDFPAAKDEDLARIQVLDDVDPEAGPDVASTSPDAVPAAKVENEPSPSRASTPHLDALVVVVRGEPTEASRAHIAELSKTAKALFVAVHARDVEREIAAKAKGRARTKKLHAEEDRIHDAWGEIANPARVYLTATPPARAHDEDPPHAHGVDELRAALLQVALEGVDISIERARKAKRPYATAIVAGAALVTAAEGMLPGAAAWVIATQVGAITSLHYLYTGRWMGRSQALALLPAFASEAVGGSAFLVAKSFLPPTGVADVIAAGVAASMTIAMLGAVTWALEQGYSLEQKSQLRMAFRRLQAKTKAERAEITRNKHRWKDKVFWTDLVRRLIFE